MGGADTTCTWLAAELEVPTTNRCCTGLLLVLVLYELLSQMLLLLLLLLLLLDREDAVRDVGVAGLPGKVRSSLALCA
jgi:hypothetical protein